MLSTHIAASIWPNRAADPTREDIIERSYHFLDDVWISLHAKSWYLGTLAVHPDYQHKGTDAQWSGGALTCQSARAFA